MAPMGAGWTSFMGLDKGALVLVWVTSSERVRSSLISASGRSPKISVAIGLWLGALVVVLRSGGVSVRQVSTPCELASLARVPFASRRGGLSVCFVFSGWAFRPLKRRVSRERRT